MLEQALSTIYDKPYNLYHVLAIASLTNLLGTIIPVTLLSGRVPRLFPRRYVLLPNVQHGKYRPLLLSLLYGLGGPTYVQFVTPATHWLLLCTPRYLAGVAVPATLQRYPQCIPTSCQLWQIHVHDSLLYEFELVSD
jgi:hypothetical protein